MGADGALSTGKMLIKPQFTKASVFSDGLATVVIGGKCGFIDKTGNVVIDPKFASAFPFSDGLASVEVLVE